MQTLWAKMHAREFVHAMIKLCEKKLCVKKIACKGICGKEKSLAMIQTSIVC
jgi:hypothetical protein